MIDYVNRGPDPRILERIPVIGWLAVRLQNWLSFKSDKHPKGITLLGRKDGGHLALTWPPFVSIFVPYGKNRYASFRAGWRHDHNWGGYVADVIVKLRINNVVTPY
jgi:hypothetical protein